MRASTFLVERKRVPKRSISPTELESTVCQYCCGLDIPPIIFWVSQNHGYFILPGFLFIPTNMSDFGAGQLFPQFYCPLTKKRLVDPYMSIACGHHFESSALEAMCRHGLVCCPHDHIPIDPRRCIQASEFKAVIEEWTKVMRVLKSRGIQDNQPSQANQQNRGREVRLQVGESFPQHALRHDGGMGNGIPTEVSACWLNTPLHNQEPQRKDNTTNGNRNGTAHTAKRQPAPPQGPSEEEDDEDKAPVDPRKYKTRLCRNWIQVGECSYEHTCCFAHGESELRDTAANHKVLNSLGYFLPDGETPPKAPVEANTKGGGHPKPQRGARDLR